MEVAVHADAAAHKIPGGIGVYTKRLLLELSRSEQAGTVSALLSRGSVLPPPLSNLKAIRSSLPLKALYASWNFLRRPQLPPRFDVIHATAFVMPPGPGELVATIHDLTVDFFPELVPRGWLEVYRRGLRLALREAAIIITDTTAIKDQLVHQHRIEPSRIRVIPLAPNLTPRELELEPHPHLAPGDPFILSVGTLDPRKNQAGLIQAFGSVADRLKDFRLVLAGVQGWGAEEAISAIRSAGLTERVILIDRPSPGNLAWLYTEAAAAAFPALYEGFGIPVLEALSFGVPTLVSRDPALLEVAGVAAINADALDVEELGEALVALVTDESLRSRLKVDGPHRASEFTWRETADETVRVYKEVGG